MITVPQLLDINLVALRTAGEDWEWIARRLRQFGQDVEDAVARPIKAENRWSGDDARAAGSTLDGICEDFQAVAQEAEAVRKFLDDVASGTGDGFGDIRQHQERALQLVDDALAHGMQVQDDGTVTWMELRAPGPLSPVEQQQEMEKQAKARSIENEMKRILHEVSGIDESLTYGLKEIFGTRDTFRTEDRNRHTGGAGLGTLWIETELAGVIADLKREGWNDAANLLLHYLGNSGKPYTVDADRMLRDIPQFQRGVDANLARIRTGPDEPFNTPWASTSPNLKDPGDNQNWYYALNHFEYRLVGEKHGGEITYQVEVKKRYDWGSPSEHRRPLDKWPIHFEQADVARLNMDGEASDFDVQGKTSPKTTK